MLRVGVVELLLLGCLLLALLCVSWAKKVPSVAEARSLAEVWNEWKVKHNKVYSDAEDLVRMQAFQNNIVLIDSMNAVEGKHIFGLSRFADLTPEEFRGLYLSGYRPSRRTGREKHEPLFAAQSIPTSFNWNDHGALTAIYNQGQCGSCWAFSATEQIESMAWLAANTTSTIKQLSMQQIVSCDTHGQDEGCNGGDTITAYAYVEETGGLEPLSDFPYTGEDSRCKFQSGDLEAAVTGWTYVTNNVTRNETQMQYYVATTAPISICVDASSWQFYLGGVISHICGQNLDHCVQIAGYSVETDIFGTKPYWIIRNSWGGDWGEKGFVYVEQFKNLCGVADEATTVSAHYLQ